MRTIELQFAGCRVRGALIESNDPADLTDDMLEIELPNQMYIQAGWFPQYSPTGKYRVITDWRTEPVVPLFYPADVAEAEKYIRSLVNRYRDVIDPIPATRLIHTTRLEIDWLKNPAQAALPSKLQKQASAPGEGWLSRLLARSTDLAINKETD